MHTPHDLTFCFFSTSDAAHSRHIEARSRVAAVMFETERPVCSPDPTTNLNAVQMECTARYEVEVG